MGVNKIFSLKRESTLRATITDTDTFGTFNFVDNGNHPFTNNVENYGFRISKFVQFIHINFGDVCADTNNNDNDPVTDGPGVSNVCDTPLEKIPKDQCPSVVTCDEKPNKCVNNRIVRLSQKFVRDCRVNSDNRYRKIQLSECPDYDNALYKHDWSDRPLRRRHSSFNVNDHKKYDTRMYHKDYSCYCHKCPRRWCCYKNDDVIKKCLNVSTDDCYTTTTATATGSNTIGTTKQFLKDFNMSYSIKRTFLRCRRQQQNQQFAFLAKNVQQNSPTLTIHVDRPFMFHICTELSSNLSLTLFSGCVVNPNVTTRTSSEST